MPESGHIDLEALPVLGRLAPIGLEEMDSIRLMNRVDTKYLTDEETLVGILGDAAEAGYRALVTNGSRIADYDSVYFDTGGLRMYLDHHNQRLVRQKVRTRRYESSGDTFLEIKRKNNHGRTKKKRVLIPPSCFGDFRQDRGACEYLAANSWFSPDQVFPALETVFRRITLVNPAKTERITIDTCVRFINLRSDRTSSLRKAVVIELKQDGRAPSCMKGILLSHRVKPVRVSKYCIGTALTDPAVKSGRFKPRIRMIEKQINDKISI